MNSIRGDDRDMHDDELTGALRAMYAAPADDSYWTSLERRIMDAVATERAREWWSWFPGWVRLGLTAAAAAALIAALASWQTRELQQRMAVDRLIGTPSEIPLLTESDRGERNAEREATLRYLITHD
jgi:anti-sigma-K factor RskA